MGGRRMVYLVTFPHPKRNSTDSGVPLVAPYRRSKSEMLQCLLDAAAHPEYTDGRSIATRASVEILRACVFREFHRPQASGLAFPHDHMTVLGARQFHFLPVKKALLKRHGLASHWSCSHNGYWSAVKYCFLPSIRKPVASLDRSPEIWPSESHPPLTECCHEPLTAAALQKRYENKINAAAESGKAEKVTELDVWPIVVQQNFRNGVDDTTAHLKLIAFAKKSCSPAMQAFLFKRRNQLPNLIDAIWQWETVDTILADASQSRVDALRAAAHGQCVCDMQWPAAVVESFMANAIPVYELCVDIFNALKQGRGETTPVIVCAGARGGEGKSLFMKGLIAAIGHDNVFPAPEPGTFPLLDLPGKKVVFMDDWRFDQTVLPYATQCRWYDGSCVRVQRPQNQKDTVGHVTYRGTAPIFVTTKLDAVERLEKLSEVNPETGFPADSNASMCFRRLKVYKYRSRMTKPTKLIPYCGKCFANLLLGQSQL